MKGPSTGMRVRWELVAGTALVAWSLLAAIAIAKYPGPNALDRLGFSAIPPLLHSRSLLRVTELGSFFVLAAGSVLAGLVAVGRDRWRAAACLIGPAAAAVLVEWVMKPLVGRRYLGVLSFPSGSVTVVAALSTSWALAVPRRLLWPAIGAGMAVSSLMAVAVVALRWHYPSDAVAGATFGVGVVLSVDGVLQSIRSYR